MQLEWILALEFVLLVVVQGCSCLHTQKVVGARPFYSVLGKRQYNRVNRPNEIQIK